MSYNAIEINSMTRTYANLAKCFAPNRMQPAGPGFADKIADKLEGQIGRASCRERVLHTV